MGIEHCASCFPLSFSYGQGDTRGIRYSSKEWDHEVWERLAPGNECAAFCHELKQSRNKTGFCETDQPDWQRAGETKTTEKVRDVGELAMHQSRVRATNQLE